MKSTSQSTTIPSACHKSSHYNALLSSVTMNALQTERLSVLKVAKLHQAVHAIGRHHIKTVLWFT